MTWTIVKKYLLKIFKWILLWFKIWLSILWWISLTNTFFKYDFFSSYLVFLLVIVLSCIAWLYKIFKKHFEYKLNWKDIRIWVKIWDITKSENFIVPINNKFDVTQPCIKKSKSVLHSTIDAVFWWDENLLYTLINNKISLWEEYKIWYILPINIKNKSIYLLSNTRINEQGRSYSKIEDLWELLDNIFFNIEPMIDKNKELAIPIVNTWHSWISSITREDILKEIIEQFINASKWKLICNKLTIYILKEDIKNCEIDFNELEEYVKNITKNYREKNWKDFEKNWRPLE